MKTGIIVSAFRSSKISFKTSFWTSMIKTQHLFLQKKTEGINRQEEIFKRFIQLIHKHCTTQREVSFYAAELFITPRYLSTIVQNVSGNTAKSIIDRHVILEIKALLQSTSLSIQEISNRLSFPDQSFFWPLFQETYRQVPSSIPKPVLKQKKLPSIKKAAFFLFI